MVGEWNHTWQVGTPPTHRWHWTGPELRKRVKPGDGLMTDDCALYRVEEVLPEGLAIAPALPDRVWDWERLERARCTILSPELAATMGG